MIVGIDLGTTNSAVAYMSADGPKLIPNALGEFLTPSVVGVEKSGAMLVGSAAKEYQVVAPDRCASLFKRRMGQDESYTLDGRSFSPEQLSSIVLRQLKQDAEAHLEEEVTGAVITVPAYFNDHQRKATLRAGRVAGLQVERIINEPTAAAVAYGLHEADEEKIAVVFDLGGGTFDVSVVELFQGTVEVRASSGESFLGGEDFTRTMAARVLEAHGHLFERAELESPLMVSRMIQQCEVAKRRLSRGASAVVRVPAEDGTISEDAETFTIERRQMDQWTQHILAQVELPIRRGLGDAGLRRADVDEVILVGGATRMPAVIDRVTQIFGRPAQCRINPDEVVALGAAVQAGLIGRDESLDDLVVTDVAPFSLGVEVAKKLGMETRGGYFMPIINRNTTIPVSRSEIVSTLRANQTEVTVSVFQGENRRVEENLLLGEFAVRDIPRGPAGQEIEIRFTYDLNGVLEVEATIVETRKRARLVIAKHARGMSEEQVEHAVEAMQSLKTHPREQSENRFLLKRAERIYRELPLVMREELGELIDGFEAALDMQEVDLIDRHHDALADFLDRCEGSLDDEEDGDEFWN